MLADSWVGSLGEAMEAEIDRYAQTPKREATKTKNAEYRSDEEIRRFIDGLLRVTV